MRLTGRNVGRGSGECVLNLSAVEGASGNELGNTLVELCKVCGKPGAFLQVGTVSKFVDRVPDISGVEVGGLCMHEKRISETYLVSDDSSGSRVKISHFQVSADVCSISILREKAIAVAVEAGVQDDTLYDIQIAVGEALANAFKHGSPRKDASRIEVCCIICPRAFAVEVRDEGPPFNPDFALLLDPESMREHGMGIYIMREAMDVVEIKTNLPGNRVRMIKWLCRDSL
ncbi:MAG: ATP-binding protein [Armatimonadota bacterium]